MVRLSSLNEQDLFVYNGHLYSVALATEVRDDGKIECNNIGFASSDRWLVNNEIYQEYFDVETDVQRAVIRVTPVP